MTNENLVARCSLARSFDVEGTGNRDSADAFEILLHVVTADFVDDAFLEHGVFEEGRSDVAVSRLYGQAHAQVRIRRLAAAKHDLLFALRNREKLQPLIVQAQVEFSFAF